MFNVMSQEKAERPWGAWEVIEKGKGYKIKKLVIQPYQSISLQYHNHRSEAWSIVEGFGEVILGDKVFRVSAGDSFVVPKKATHKITAISKTPLIAIEVQLGEITQEDDIVRLGIGEIK
jgi:mannose-6-phosphate isomerase-like protein (cupin superfamily)